MNRIGFGRNDPCFCGSGKKYKKCCYPRTLPDFSKPNAGLPDPFEEQEAMYRALSRQEAQPSQNGKMTIETVDVGRTRLTCAALAPEGHGDLAAGTLAPPTALQIEAKYEEIGRSNPEGVTEIVVNYTCPEMFGIAEARAVFDADEEFQLACGGTIGALDLFRGMQVVMSNGTVGTIVGNPERRYDIPVPPMPQESGLWTSRVVGRWKHTAYEIVEFHWAGQMVRVTPGHVVWSASRRGWVGAHELYQGERIRVGGNVVAPVEGAKRISQRIEVYGIEVEYFHNYFVGNGPNAMLVHNGPPECLVRPAVAEALEQGAIRQTGRRAAGVLTEAELNPQHHIFPQARRQWFADRGVDIDRFAVRLDRTTHDALHAGGGPGRGGGWWNDTIMAELTRREAALGRRLTPAEIEAVGRDILQQRNLGNLPIVPYEG